VGEPRVFYHRLNLQEFILNTEKWVFTLSKYSEVKATDGAAGADYCKLSGLMEGL